MIKYFTLSFLISILFFPLLQAQECSDRYRAKVFSKIDVDANIVFGQTEISGASAPLRYDVYMPHDDTVALRPLVILWHGGGFLDMFKKTSPDIVALAKDLAKAGYVVISPDYRGIRDFSDLLNKKELIKEVVKAAIDGNKAICHILDQIENQGNPYRINQNEIFAGGVSGGAVLGLHLILMNSVSDLPAEFVAWAREVDGGVIDQLFDTKYCNHPNIIKGFFSISGGIVDTAFIKPTPTDFIFYHGTADPLIPYDKGKPMGGLYDAPDLYGSKPIHEKMEEIGMHSILYSYPGVGHVPFLNLDLVSFFKQWNLVNKDIYIETLETMTDYMFSKIECVPLSTDTTVATSIRNTHTQALRLYPNPTNSTFEMDLPESGKWQLSVFNLSGKLIEQSSFQGVHFQQSIEQYGKGIYFIQVKNLGGKDLTFYGKVIHP